jgi:NADH dehydrogenase FAD-containing subunit
MKRWIHWCRRDDKIKKSGKNVTLIEAMEHLFPASFNKDFGNFAEEEIENENVRVLVNTKAKEITGNNKEEIPADLVIMAQDTNQILNWLKKWESKLLTGVILKQMII